MTVSFRRAFDSEWFRLRKRKSTWWSLLAVCVAGFAGSAAPRIEEKINIIQVQTSGGGRSASDALNAFVYLSTGAKGAFAFSILFLALGGAAAIAGEASAGTLRITLARPVSRSTVFAAKWYVLVIQMLMMTTLGMLSAAAGAATVADFGPAVREVVKSSASDLLQYTLLAYVIGLCAITAILGLTLLIGTVTRTTASAATATLGFLSAAFLLQFAVPSIHPWLFPSFGVAPFDVLRSIALGHDAPRPVWFGMPHLQDWADITFAVCMPAACAFLLTLLAGRIFSQRDWLQ